MKLILCAALLIPALCTLRGSEPAPEPKQVNAMIDLAHEFSFYGDGRFASQYLKGQQSVRNFADFKSTNLSNINLFIMLGAFHKVPYTPEDAAAIKKYMEEGGTALLFCHPNAKTQISAFADTFGFQLKGRTAQPPLKAETALTSRLSPSPTTIISRADAATFSLEGNWEILISDAKDSAVMASRKVGKGRLVIAARALAGQQPDAKDNINAEWLTPLLPKLVEKNVNPNAPLNGRDLQDMGHQYVAPTGITYHYNSYLSPCFQKMLEIETKCRPMIEKRMGVPLSGANGETVCLLSTDGGGFSSGHIIALAVFWENFPDYQPGMIEFITHESVHSWVHPFREIWNEPIATYMGDLVMADMGYPEESAKRIAGNIARASRLDPEMNRYDLNGNPLVPNAKKLSDWEKNDIHWGKSFWVLEQLRAKDPDVMAKYFKVKRRLADPNKISDYSENETVSVFSEALGEDLFPWFNQHGFKVDPKQSKLTFSKKK